MLQVKNGDTLCRGEDTSSWNHVVSRTETDTRISGEYADLHCWKQTNDTQENQQNYIEFIIMQKHAKSHFSSAIWVFKN